MSRRRTTLGTRRLRLSLARARSKAALETSARDDGSATEIRFDENGLVPCVVQDGRRRGADARLHERRGAASARARRGRPTSTAARVASSGTRARPPATCSGCASCATTATRMRWWRWSSPPVRPATRASAPASTVTSNGGAPAPAAPRGAGGPRADPRRARDRASRGLVHGGASRRPAANRREGARGGRGGRPCRGGRVRRTRRRGGSGRPLPPAGSAALARGSAERRDGDAQWPSR